MREIITPEEVVIIIKEALIIRMSFDIFVLDLFESDCKSLCDVSPVVIHICIYLKRTFIVLCIYMPM